MASIEKIVEGDGVITVYFNSPYTVQVADISTQQPQQPQRQQQQQQLRWVVRSEWGGNNIESGKLWWKQLSTSYLSADLANCDCHQ